VQNFHGMDVCRAAMSGSERARVLIARRPNAAQLACLNPASARALAPHPVSPAHTSTGKHTHTHIHTPVGRM
jgi:hypothetical protein